MIVTFMGFNMIVLSLLGHVICVNDIKKHMAVYVIPLEICRKSN